MTFDPTRIRLSRHFLLSDFLGNHSVYTRGLKNILLPDDPELPLKMRNARALCDNLLEPLLEQAGPFSISYGYISNELSRKIVTYQSPDKPSHHQFNLGAAADICVHEWTNHDPEDDSEKTSPIALAHEIHAAGYPYSRLITYSESPYICVAVSEKEVHNNAPRKAFYENRYTGVKGAKPNYKSLATAQAKARAKEQLSLEHGWRGEGYPTYHGGGRKQYHHWRTSDYTMLSDWLFDLKSITNGVRNIVPFTSFGTINAFYAAGAAYDHLVRATGINRFSIVSGYLSAANPSLEDDLQRCWTEGFARYQLRVPEGVSVPSILKTLRGNKLEGYEILTRAYDDTTLEVNAVRKK